MFILLFYIFSFFLISFSFKNNPAFDSAALKTFSYANLAKIAIYAGIPAVIIGSFFPAFNLPYLSFDRIYFIITSVYSFFIIRSFAVKLRLINRANSDEDDFWRQHKKIKYNKHIKDYGDKKWICANSSECQSGTRFWALTPFQPCS